MDTLAELLLLDANWCNPRLIGSLKPAHTIVEVFVVAAHFKQLVKMFLDNLTFTQILVLQSSIFHGYNRACLVHHIHTGYTSVLEHMWIFY